MKIAKLISFQAPNNIMTRELVLKSYSSYEEILKMYLPELGGLMELFYYRPNQIPNYTRCSQDVLFMPCKSHSKRS